MTVRDDRADDATEDADDVKALVRRHWNRRAPTFDEEPEHATHSDAQRERWLAVLDEWAGDPPRRTIDVGCGTGTISVLLAALGHDVLGVDAAPKMVGRARRKAADAGHSIAFLLGDATALGVPDDAAELVVERHLLWTLPDPRTALAEWRRVLEPGGRLVLFEGRWNHDGVGEEYEQIGDGLPLYRGATAGELRELLTSVGLVDVASEPLDDPVLRGGENDHDYHVVAGTSPD